jgi:heme/copper-type cytochrome/quinol oxidase subunit 2
MYELAIFISIVLTLLLFVVGGIVGWIVSLYLNKEEDTQPFIHPEFMDASGNILPDEILALRFTPKLDIEEDYYDTDPDEEEAEDYGETS